MKKLLSMTLIVLFSVALSAQSGKIQIYDQFYMGMHTTNATPVGSCIKNCHAGGNFLLKITLDRTQQTCTAKPSVDNPNKRYVFPLKPSWPDVREYDTFTIEIIIEHGVLEFQDVSRAYAGLINPTYRRNIFTAKASAPIMSNISRGIPMLQPYFTHEFGVCKPY